MHRALALSLLWTMATVGIAAAQPSDDFHWTGSIPRGRAIEIQGVSGDIRADLAKGSEVEVVARKTAPTGDPDAVQTVQIVVLPPGSDVGDVTIRAVYPEHTRHNDVRVDFTVHVPAGVRLRAKTVNGAIEAVSLQSDVDATTVNGPVQISTTGVASAKTVNGSVDASLGAAGWTEPLDFRTVNGSVTIELPRGIGAEVRADTLNGTFSSDFPMEMTTARARGARITGTIGAGGHELDIHTLNGKIRVQTTNGR